MKKLLTLIILLTLLTLPAFGQSNSAGFLLNLYRKSFSGSYEVPSDKVMVVGAQSTHETDVLRAFIKGYESAGGTWTGDTLTFTSTGNIQDAFDYAIANGYSTVIRSYTNAAGDTSKALLNYPEIQYFAAISNSESQVFDTHIALPSLIMPGTDSSGLGNVTAWNVEFLAIDPITAVGSERASSYSNGYLAGQLCYIAHRLNVDYWTARYLARQAGTTYAVRNGYGLINIANVIASYNPSVNYDLLDPYLYLPNVPTLASTSLGDSTIRIVSSSSAGDDSTRLYRGTTWIASLALNGIYIDSPLVVGAYTYEARNIKRMSLGTTSATVADTVVPLIPTIAVVGGANKITVTSAQAWLDSLRIYAANSAGATVWKASIPFNTATDVPLGGGSWYVRAKTYENGVLSNYSIEYNVTVTVPPDTVPNAFAFTDTTGCELTTEYKSDSVVVTGFDSAYCYAGGAKYWIGRYGDTTTTYSMIHNADTVWVKNTSSGSNSTAVNTVLTIGGVSDTYTITTKAVSGPNNIFVFYVDKMSELGFEADFSITINDYVATCIEDLGEGECIWETTFSNTGYTIPDYSETGVLSTLLSVYSSALIVGEEGLLAWEVHGTQSLILPLATTIRALAFANCKATTISLPSCTDLGGTTSDDDVFANVTGLTITLTVPSALMTCNEGDPDGDIVTLQANNTVTIINP